jgi:hypothetical protein
VAMHMSHLHVGRGEAVPRAMRVRGGTLEEGVDLVPCILDATDGKSFAARHSSRASSAATTASASCLPSHLRPRGRDAPPVPPRRSPCLRSARPTSAGLMQCKCGCWVRPSCPYITESNNVVLSSEDQSLCDIHYVKNI